MNLLDAQIIIDKAMLDHGLSAKGWKFAWDNAKRRFGRCKYNGKMITMSQKLVELNSEENTRDTILHEIAHALVGPGHKHDVFWRMTARKIGARPIACYDSTGVVKPPARFIGKCMGCNQEVVRYRMTNRVCEQAFHTACRRAGKESKIEWRRECE